jgi:predicted enzyme related to lactoylglutathione lyase
MVHQDAAHAEVQARAAAVRNRKSTRTNGGSKDIAALRGRSWGTCERIRKLVAKGAMSGLSFEVDDCRATYSELKDRGVEMIQEPNKVPWGIDAAFRDLFGNHLRFVQMIS